MTKTLIGSSIKPNVNLSPKFIPYHRTFYYWTWTVKGTRYYELTESNVPTTAKTAYTSSIFVTGVNSLPNLFALHNI
jgi:hypothetical protein